MELWTIQRKEVLEEINKKGYYAPLVKNTMAYKYGGGFKDGYELMVEELYKKDKRKKRNKYPVWAFLQPINAAEFGVDEEGYIEIKLDIPDERILLSDFSLYHCVLNNGYCSSSDEDYIKYLLKFFGSTEHFNLLPEFTIEEHDKYVRESWRNIFDVANTDTEDIQACFWFVGKEDVVSYRDISEKEFRKKEKDS